MLPDPAQGFIVPTSLAVVAAFAAGYRLTTHYHQIFVAWLLASLAIPAGYILCAQLLLPDAQDGWGAIAYIFGTSYPVLAGNVGVMLGAFSLIDTLAMTPNPSLDPDAHRRVFAHRCAHIWLRQLSAATHVKRWASSHESPKRMSHCDLVPRRGV